MSETEIKRATPTQAWRMLGTDDQAVLQYAMGREHVAMSHYGELAETAPPGAVKDLFAYLASEETRHKLELEKLYYETVHRGGGV